MERLDGRTAVVTGAASGIGLAIVEAFVAEGMRVVMADVDEENLDTAATRLGDEGAVVRAVAADVADPTSVEHVGRTTVEAFGGLHVAVNNAGIVNRGLAWELSLEEWHRIVDVDLWGVIHGIHTFVPRMLATGDEGHVVNVASMAAVHTIARLGPYTAAKHGVLGLSDVLALDLASIEAPVGVSVVMPGMIKTTLNPIGTVAASTVASNVVDAMRRGRRYVFTDDHSSASVESRLGAILGPAATSFRNPPATAQVRATRSRSQRASTTASPW